MNWLQKCIYGTPLDKVAYVEQMSPQEATKMIFDNVELYNYNATYALLNASGQPLPEEIAKEKIATAIMSAGTQSFQGFLSNINRSVMSGKPLSVDVNLDNGISVIVNDMTLPAPLFEEKLYAAGARIEQMARTGKQKERMQNRQQIMDNRSQQLDTMGADELLTEANRTAYLLAHTRVERDIPRTKKEKYDTSYHFTISAGQGATLEQLTGMLDPAALSGARFTDTSIRVTNKAAVAALIDQLGLTVQLPLIRGKIGEGSENIPLVNFQDSVYRDFRRRAIAKQLPETDLKEYWDAGLSGTFFAK